MIIMIIMFMVDGGLPIASTCSTNGNPTVDPSYCDSADPKCDDDSECPKECKCCIDGYCTNPTQEPTPNPTPNPTPKPTASPSNPPAPVNGPAPDPAQQPSQ